MAEKEDAPLIDLNEASVKKLISKARKRGYVTYDELNEALPSGEMSPDQIEDIQTVVKFRDLPDAELDAYLRLERPYDCAGSAKNEALGIAILERIDSADPTALTGLPLIALTGMLRRIGVSFFNT